MKNSKLILRGAYFTALLLIAGMNTSCNDAPIEPLNEPNNQVDTTWVDDSTNWNPNGGGNTNPNDSSNWDPNGGGNTNPNDSTNWDPNGGGSTNPNDSTSWDPNGGGNTNPNDSLGGGN